MAHHFLEPNAETLKGFFDRADAPILTIDPGDSVTYRLLDAGWGLGPRDPVTGEREKFPCEPGSGHALIGPTSMSGAKTGMTLVVSVDELVPGPYGWGGGWFNFPAAWLGRLEMPEGEGSSFWWNLDTHRKTARNEHGHEVSIEPFLGVMGMPPDEPGRHSTAPPRFCGGNLDCTRLQAGSTLYLPVPVDGGLFYCGDGHGRQGDGEVSQVALECPMDVARLTFGLCSVSVRGPIVETSSSLHFLGFGDDLVEATAGALNLALDVWQSAAGCSRSTALGLASLLLDLRVTQICNGTQGVHASLRKGDLAGVGWRTTEVRELLG